MKKYVTPELHVDEFAADTMIASGAVSTKNGNAGNNQNCWGCNLSAGSVDQSNPENACSYIYGTAAYDYFCYD